MTKYLDNEGLTHFTGKMKGYADGKAGEVDGKVTTHVGNKQNPHGVTKAQVGLSKVINETQIPSNQKGFPNGVATLDANGKVPVEQMPDIKTINGDPIFGKGDLQLSASLYKIVDKLPTTGIDTSKIYLVPASATTAKNNKTEYIYLGDPNKAYDESKWEKLGDEQKSASVVTPGGTITVDTAFNTESSNPIANKTVAAKFNEVVNTLNGKVPQGTYDTKMGAIDKKLTALENKTITVDAELKSDSTNPIQNKAVKSAVDTLNTEIGKKANSTDLNAATGKITTLENNAATILSVTGEGNGISSISKSGNTITATKATFLTSAAGLATTAALNDGLAKKADVNHNHDTKYAAKKHTHPEYAQSSALNDYVTNTALDEKKFLTDTSLAGYVNAVQPDGTSGNGIASITKEGKTLKVTKATFLTGHQSLDGYVNNVKVTGVANGNGIASIAKNGKDINVTQGAFLTAIDGIIAETGEAVAGKGVTDISIRGNKLVKKTGTFITPETLGTSIDDYAKDKGYLTKDNLNEKLKETVIIKLVSDKSDSDTGLIGATITVKSGDKTVNTQTWQGTPINVKVPCDKDVTVEVGTVKMYMKPKALKYIPSPLYNREVTFTYKALEIGVFFIDINDNLIYSTSWDYNKDTIVGVALITEKVAIVMAPGAKQYLKWSEQAQLVEGVTTTTKYADAIADFNGKANTEAIVKALGQNAPAAYYCSNYTFKNGRKGHLMSAGEAYEMSLNENTLSTMLNSLDSSSVNFDTGNKYWISTQASTDLTWIVDNKMYISSFNKTYTQPYTIPIYSLYD
jgi:hypothetical protein